jgi:hypothetical protein
VRIESYEWKFEGNVFFFVIQEVSRFLTNSFFSLVRLPFYYCVKNFFVSSSSSFFILNGIQEKVR